MVIQTQSVWTSYKNLFYRLIDLWIMADYLEIVALSNLKFEWLYTITYLYGKISIDVRKVFVFLNDTGNQIP